MTTSSSSGENRSAERTNSSRESMKEAWSTTKSKRLASWRSCHSKTKRKCIQNPWHLEMDAQSLRKLLRVEKKTKASIQDKKAIGLAAKSNMILIEALTSLIHLHRRIRGSEFRKMPRFLVIWLLSAESIVLRTYLMLQAELTSLLRLSRLNELQRISIYHKLSLVKYTTRKI